MTHDRRLSSLKFFLFNLGCNLEDVTNLLATELEALLLPSYILHLVDGHHKLLAPTLAELNGLFKNLGVTDYFSQLLA